MDKSWILKSRTTPEYREGLLKFLDFAFANSSSDNKILCPCSGCRFRLLQSRAEVFDHLLETPFPAGYTFWLLHGERDNGETSTARHEKQRIETPEDSMQHMGIPEDSIQHMINDAFDFGGELADQEEEDWIPPLHTGPSDKMKDFFELVRDGEQELYEGCSKYSKLSFLLRLYHIKCLCGMTDKAMTMILELLRDAFDHARIPQSFYEAKKTIKKLGLGYDKIDACPNDCMLYRGADAHRQECKRCHTSRWKPMTKKSSEALADKKKKPKPAKVLCYFPLIPRLQRLFMCSKTATDMRWHSVDHNNDGFLRHPRDGEAWKKFDSTFPEFSRDPRNVRLGLASDGFNPFGNMSTSYSIWPVVLIPYNTPPWKCMKQTSFILSMIIPGKRMPGNDIDVYLQPLIDELKILWDGVNTFDASSNETFNMRAALMWTISDFPGYGNLSGWNTYDYKRLDLMDQWIWLIEYNNDKKTKEMRKRNAENRKKQAYTYAGGSKSIPRLKAEKEQQLGRRISRGEIWTIAHKGKDGKYVNDAAKVVGEQIEEIEHQNGPLITISPDDAVGRVLGKEHPGRVRCMGLGPTPTQVFGHATHQRSRNSFTQIQDNKMDEIKSELEAEKSKVRELESVVDAEKLKRQKLESVVGFISKCFMNQGGDMPPELAAIVNAMASNDESGPIGGVGPSSSTSRNV